MHMSETRRVRDDGVCYKRHLCVRVRLYAGVPASVQHFVYHLSFFCNLTTLDGFKFGNDAGIFDHILDLLVSLGQRCFSYLQLLRTAIREDGSPPMG